MNGSGSQTRSDSKSEARPSESTAPAAARIDGRPVSPAQPSIDLRIDELILHGFEPAQRYDIGEAMEHELGRLLAERGTPLTMTEAIEIEHLNAGSINVDSSSPRNTGREIARAVYGQLDV